jgi:diaminopimelate epimerase
MNISFTKMHGLGNDFMVIDAINQKISLSSERIKQLSDRHFGVGFDQLLLVEKTNLKNIDFKYRIFNADGSEVEQCGNGARCFVKFVVDKGLTDKTEVFVETKNRNMRIKKMAENAYCVNVGLPIFTPKDIPFNQLKSENATYTVDGYQVGVVSMGNPHAVLIVNDINQEIESIAKTIQNSGDFPNGVNVNFVEITDKSNITLRVYERGVGETLACGSGACATVAYLDLIGKVNAKDKDILVSLRGGKLLIGVKAEDGVFMVGDAEFVFEGQIKI